MLKRRVVGAAVAAACAVLLTSCSSLPYIPGLDDADATKAADARMQHIEDAVKHHDAAALNKLFSPGAKAEATDLDAGVDYFLSLFPSGQMTWKITQEGPGGTGTTVASKQMRETLAYYDVTANGKQYELFFADVTVDDFHPEDVGIYGLGIARNDSGTSAEYTDFDDPTPFYDWIDTFGVDNLGDTLGDAGVFVPQR